MSKIGKLLLVATSLAPILGAFSVHSFATCDAQGGFRYLGIALALVLICWLILKGCKRTLPEETLKTARVKTADREVLAFLLVYLLPLFTKDLIFTGNFFAPAYIFVVIGLCVYHSNSFTFNPGLSMMGYHFYEIEIKDGMNYLLVSKQTLRRNDNTIRVKELADYIYLES